MTMEVTEGVVQALLDAGTDIAGLADATDDSAIGVYGVVPEGHQIAFLDLAWRLEKHRDHPSRKKGSVTVTDQRSFKHYWSKHASPSTEVYADVDSGTVTAVIDAHGTDEAGWAEHRCTLTLRVSPAWKRWTTLNNRLITQTQFAEHIEQSRTEITSPDSATLLEIAQTIQATNSARFESGVQLSSGQRRFQYSETIAAKAGQSGQLEIPATFMVLLQPWVAGPAIEAEALLRYRIGHEGLTLGYTLTPDPVELREAVFDQLVREIEDDLNGRTPGEEPADPGEDGVIVHRGRYFDPSNRY